ncbi:Uncharacterised protein [Acinetobacter baumannii]|nr:Uncharacterised protein [Acinetobacter baumannii]
MKLQQVIDHLSVGETLDIKELIHTLIEDPDMEKIYEKIKDTN